MNPYRSGVKKKFLLWSFIILITFSIVGSILAYVLVTHFTLSLPFSLTLVSLFYILIGGLGILTISKIMVQPVLKLTHIIREVRNGNLDIKESIPVVQDPSDEMDLLFVGFKEMVDRLKHNIQELKTAKERAEEISRRLAKVNTKLQAIFSGIPDGIMIIDRAYRIVDVNPVMQKLMGKSLEELRGQHCFEMCQGIKSRCSFCRADVVFQLAGQSYTQCTKKTSFGEEERMFEIYDFPLVNEKGEVEQVIEYVKDVTEAVKMQKHLEQAKNLAEIGKMGSIVAHEVRNPLNAISGAVRYLKGEIRDENLQTYLNLIEEQIQRVNGVTDEMLDYARPLFLDFSYSQIQNHINKALAMMEERLRAKRIRVNKKIDNNLPLLPLDGPQVERALANLIENAIDAMDEGGELTIKCRYDKDAPPNTVREVEVIIADNGKGLDGRDPEELFKPFVTTKLRGTGLGLPVVKKIMNSHQGSVRLISPQNGKGTMAILRFPTTMKVYEAKEYHLSYR